MRFFFRLVYLSDISNSIMAQVFVVTAAGSVIAFIIRDLGDGSIAGWVIQESCSLLLSLL